MAADVLTPRRRAPGTWQAWWLAALLLAAQGLGLWHGVEHGGPHPPGRLHARAQVPGDMHGQVHGHVHRVAHEASASSPVPDSPAFWPDGHEPGSAECRLVDALAHADVLCLAEAAAPSPSPVTRAAAVRRWAAPAAAPAAAYRARAPPLA